MATKVKWGVQKRYDEPLFDWRQKTDFLGWCVVRSDQTGFVTEPMDYRTAREIARRMNMKDPVERSTT